MSDHRDAAGVGGAAGATWMMSMASSLWQRASSFCGATSWVQRFDSSSRARAISSLTLALGGGGARQGSAKPTWASLPGSLPASCLPKTPRSHPLPSCPHLGPARHWPWTHHLVGEERGLQQPDLRRGQEGPESDSLQLGSQLGAVEDVAAGRGAGVRKTSTIPPALARALHTARSPSLQRLPPLPLHLSSIQAIQVIQGSPCLCSLSHPCPLLLQVMLPKPISLEPPRQRHPTAQPPSPAWHAAGLSSQAPCLASNSPSPPPAAAGRTTFPV